MRFEIKQWRDWGKLTNQNGNRSVPLPASTLVSSFARSFQVPARRRPTGIRPTADLVESFSFRDVDGFCGPHQLTAGRAENAIIGRAEAGEPPDHRGMNDPDSEEVRGANRIEEYPESALQFTGIPLRIDCFWSLSTTSAL